MNAPPAADPTGVEVGDRGLEVVQCVLLRVQGDRAPGREGHQVAQVVVGADQVADDVLLGRDQVDRRHDDVLAVAHDVVVAGLAGHRQPLRGRAALSHEVDDHLGTEPTRDLQHLLDLTTRLRRTIHAKPELGLQNPVTQELILSTLQGLPFEVTTGTSCTSVTAVLRTGRPGPVPGPDAWRWSLHP